jgi:hypothetical protein
LPGNFCAATKSINAISRTISKTVHQTRKIKRWSSAGASAFFAEPHLSAQVQRIFWSPNCNTSVLMLTETPADFAKIGYLKPLFTTVKSDSSGVHGFSENDRHTSQVIVLRGASADGALSALVPLDADALGRVEALTRFCCAQQKRAIPPDTRLTAQQRRRLRLMIQATDGRSNGATYREIAQILYGVLRVADMPWKTSPLRDSAIALVRDGLAMVGGGYHQLLRHRRRF